MTQKQQPFGVTRRNALKTGLTTAGLLVGGTVLGSTAFTGRALGHPKPENHDIVWGDDIDYLDGVVRTYATTNPQGNLSSLGVYLDADALAVFDEDPLHHHLHLPDGVDTHEFTFVGFDYNPAGHPPPDVYTVPHFDVHFYMISPETVESIQTGPATYDITSDQIPEDYSRLPVIDTDDDGAPDTPVVEEDMGEHLADLSSPEFQEGGEFTHTMIYGAYDVDDDGVGALTFVEPMVTVAFLDDLEEELEVDMKTPEAYEDPGDYPTQYVLEPGLHGGRFISIDDFTEFPGSSG
jgi:hypothetical protein